MSWEKSWVIARKDFAIFWRKRSILYALVAFPLGVAIGLPSLLVYLHARRSLASFASVSYLFDAFLFFFMIAAVVISTTLAAYSIVGEKTERSLEPLLATPTSDGEILFGKVLAAFLPTLIATLVGAAIFMTYVDAISHADLGYFYYPDTASAVYLGLAMPLACLFSVEANIFLSSRVTDVRSAQQAGSLMVFPFAAIYVASEVQLITLDNTTLLAISGVLAVVDVALFFLARATFQREEILTRWR
ncbi:MAG: ABC transporter permease subunit [Thermoplasmata archaeon]